jgi:hypothetical protein
MKNKYYLLLLFSNLLVFVNAQNYQWSNTGGSVWNEETNLCKDTLGNYFLSGYLLSGPSHLVGGEAYFDLDTAHILGNSDIFLAKYNHSGELQWIKTCGSQTNDVPNEYSNVVYDKNSNSIYLFGYFSETAYFGDTLLVNSGGLRGFISKVDQQGNFLWAIQMGSGFSNPTFDSYGNLYVIALADSLNPNNSTQFLSKIDSEGNLIWTKSINNVNTFLLRNINLISDSLYISVDGKNNGYIDTMFVSSPYEYNNLYAVFDTIGSIQRIKINGSPKPTGNRFVSFSNRDCINIISYEDSIYIENNLFTCNGKGLLLLKYNLDSQVAFVKKIEYSGYLLSNNIDYDGNSIYFTGSFEGQLTYDSTYFIDASGTRSTFVLKINDNGVLIDGFSIPNTEARGIVINDDESFVINGRYKGTLQLGSSNYTSFGLYDIFLATLDPLTDIKEYRLLKNNKLLIYANPNNGTCKIKIPESVINYENIKIRIEDMNGKLIFNGRPEESQGNILIDIQEKGVGQYIVTLMDGNKKYDGVIIFNR